MLEGISGTGINGLAPSLNELHITGGRPIQPRLSFDIYQAGQRTHGVLMTGGSFVDIPLADPVISTLITDDNYTYPESTFPVDEWYPVHMASINRALTIDGPKERLVIVPGQFLQTDLVARAGLSQTLGTQRLYESLDLEIYKSPFESDDFIAPRIWQVEALRSGNNLEFVIEVNDNSEVLERVLILYRTVNSNTWTALDLDYDAQTTFAKTSIADPDQGIYYFAQAVDPSGNVALALDKGKPFSEIEDRQNVYLPFLLK